jgi:hypothetical protein
MPSGCSAPMVYFTSPTRFGALRVVVSGTLRNSTPLRATVSNNIPGEQRDVQLHSRHRPPQSPLMRASPLQPGHQSGSRQCLLRPCVAQLGAGLILDLLVKLADIQIPIHFPVQPQHPRLSPAEPACHSASLCAIRRARVAMFLDLFPPSSDSPVRCSRNLRRRPPGELLHHRLRQHVLHFHHPLHLGERVLPGLFHDPSFTPPPKADNSCVNPTGQITY